MSSDEERHFQLEHLSFPSRVPPLKGLNKYIDYYYPGLAPWAMQECRPCRAHLGPHLQSIMLLF